MKYFKLLSALITFSLIISCSDDDDENTVAVDQETLMGTWELISFNANTDFSTEIMDVPVTGSTNTIGENIDYVMNFTETTYSASGSFDIVTTGTANGIPLEVMRETVDNVNVSGTYQLVDGELIIENSLMDLGAISPELEGMEMDSSIEVAFNSNDELILEQSDEISFETEGYPYTVEYNLITVYKRP